MSNRRCTQREFLLRPDAATNQTYLYCLAVAVQRYEIDMILPSAMSNHHHDVMYDRHGREVEFREFHGLLARAMNALRGRCENFWSSEAPCVVELVNPTDERAARGVLRVAARQKGPPAGPGGRGRPLIRGRPLDLRE